MWMLLLSLAVAGGGQPEGPAKEPSGLQEPVGGWPEPGVVVKGLMAEAEKLRPLMKTELARRFLAGAGRLPEPMGAVVYRDAGRTKALSAAEWERLPEAERAGWTKKEYAPGFFYTTGYGSPLVYARVLDVVGEHWTGKAPPHMVMDFGYGSIGQILLMAEMDWTAIGVDVDPVLRAIYWRYAIEQPIRKENGFARVVTGRWPAEEAAVKAVASKGQYDVITSKNTLKRGYIHPEPPKGKTVDEKQLVKLGVDDGAFLKAVHGRLKEGGLFVIYNICPAQSPAEDLSKPYIPWADGRCPFTKEQLEAAGFEVLAYDRDDQAWVLECWKALGYDGGKAKEESAKETFAEYTVVRRK